MKTITLITSKISIKKLNSLHDKLNAKGYKLIVVIN